MIKMVVMKPSSRTPYKPNPNFNDAIFPHSEGYLFCMIFSIYKQKFFIFSQPRSL